MKAVLKIELIGDSTNQRWNLGYGIVRDALGQKMADTAIGRPPSNGWCAEISILPGDRIDRSFLRGQKDYSEANGIGSRGVYLYFYLDEWRVYEVFERTSWKSSERYFCTVRHGNIVKISKEEAIRCLKNR